MAKKQKTISRGVDYLGALVAHLRDLRGLPTLAFELIQNADDAPGASSITFRVSPEALVVDNDGRFSSCGSPQEPNCVWGHDPERRHLCDFHRLRLVASGDKRQEGGTTGAFGIGFTSVYQITDRPELISSGEHWILREELAEDQRIEVCEGCADCGVNEVQPTRFVLPWAYEADSDLRKRLGVEPTPPDIATQFCAEVRQALPRAALFLQQLSRLELKPHDQAALTVERELDDFRLTLRAGDTKTEFLYVEGDFETEAERLREQYIHQIEEKKSSRVQVALPIVEESEGLFYATLPTQHLCRLPLHINADFFPASDRKSIAAEGDYQGVWNRAAVDGAAEAVAEALPVLRDRVSPAVLWQLLESSEKLASAQHSDGGAVGTEAFWKHLGPEVESGEFILLSDGSWADPSNPRILVSPELEAYRSLLDRLDLPLVHASLRPYQNVLQRVGVKGLQPDDIANATTHLVKKGLAQWLADPGELEGLWTALSLSLSAEVGKSRAMSLASLHEAPLALTTGCELQVCENVFRGTESTVKLFRLFDPQPDFLHEELAEHPLAGDLCQEFGSEQALEFLEKRQEADIRSMLEDGPTAATLIKWFASRGQEISEHGLGERIAELAIYPSAGGLSSLTELTLPGDFHDPIGVAKLIATDRVGATIDFLRDLGVEELSFANYVRKHVPMAVSSGRLSRERTRALVGLLASELGRIRDDTDLRGQLEDLALVECSDGAFRKADEVYFRSPMVSKVLGNAAVVAKIRKAGQDATRALYDWLGVRSRPVFEDIVARVRKLVAQPPQARIVEALEAIVEYLNEEVGQAREMPTALEPLKTTPWLPSQGSNKWYRPADVFAVYQKYLFASQGQFLGLSANSQRTCAKLIELIGIRSSPETPLVVKHLLHCAAGGERPNKEVYRFLSDHAAEVDPRQLLDSHCLYFDDRGFVSPKQVFWSDHPFGHRRLKLGPELRPYGPFLERIGVRESPEAENAILVLRELGEEYGHSPLSEQDHAIAIRCWGVLSDSLDQDRLGEAVEGLGGEELIPNDRQGVLYPARNLLFEDLAGLDELFPRLSNNLISHYPEAAAALTMAGVRSLRAAAVPNLVELGSPVADPDTEDLMRQRQGSLRRVIADHSRSGAHIEVQLGRLSCKRTQVLRVSYTIQLWNRSFESEAHVARSLLLTNGSGEAAELFLTDDEGQMPWSDVAREVALYLVPAEHLRSIVSGVYTVLSAPSVQEAERALDAQGYPPLRDLEAVDDSAVTGTLGGEELSGDAAGVPPGWSEPTGDDLKNEDSEPGDSSGGGGDGGGGKPAGPNQSGEEGDSAQRRSRRTGKFRTYVSAGSEEAQTDGRSTQADKDEVDRAGVDYVLKKEREAGREPEELKHDHEGWDIDSVDPVESTTRFIEVKSIRGPWTQAGVALSKPQFDTGKKFKDRYWLYIVENATSDSPNLIRIQDPAGRANEFFYDDGWRVVAMSEAEQERSEGRE